MDCLHCKYARKASNTEYVGCVALSSLDYENEKYWFTFYDRESICTGWVDLRSYPDGISSGMITNGVPCFKKDDICKHFVSRNE